MVGLLMTSLTGLFLLAGALAAQTPSGPDARMVRLSYEVDAGVEGCPDVATFRTWVATRLGRDPVADNAPERMRVVVRAKGKNLIGSVVSEDESGHRTGVRKLPDEARDCAELMATLAFTVSVAIDPTAAYRNPPPVIVKPSPPPPPPAPIKTEPVATSKLFALVSGSVTTGVIPEVGWAIGLGVGFRREWLSAQIEGRFVFPSDTAVPSETSRGTIRSNALLFALLGCAHRRALFLCLATDVGDLNAKGEDFVKNYSPNKWFARAGARFGAELELGERVAVGLVAESMFAIAPVAFRVDSETPWSMPRLSVGAIAQTRIHF